MRREIKRLLSPIAVREPRLHRIGAISMLVLKSKFRGGLLNRVVKASDSFVSFINFLTTSP